MVFYFQGTSIAFAAFSEGRVVNRIDAAVLLSPIAYLDRASAPIVQLAKDLKIDKVSKLVSKCIVMRTKFWNLQ